MLENTILFCLPYAGGSARSFANVTYRLSHAMEINVLELPGRGERRLEPLCTDLNTMVEEFYTIICKTVTNTESRVLIWGHSMGAVLALLIACKLSKNKDCHFDGLIVSAMTSPAGKKESKRKLHQLPQEEFIKYFEKLIPSSKSELHDRMKEIMFERMQVVLRADIAALENLKIKDWLALVVDVPIYVLIGKQDEIMPKQQEYYAWKHHTPAPVKYYLMNGGHFFVLDHPEQTASTLLKIVNEVKQPC
jgi:surfactin synthase thioesterase subunit